MSPKETKVLRALVEHGTDYCGFCFLNFASISDETGFDRKTVRRACRSLTRKGLAEFGKGLWTEDGEPAGSGYCATKSGHAALTADLSRDRTK